MIASISSRKEWIETGSRFKIERYFGEIGKARESVDNLKKDFCIVSEEYCICPELKEKKVQVIITIDGKNDCWILVNEE